MSTTYYREMGYDPFREIKKEEDYKNFYSRIHDWNKNNILDLQIALVESIFYFRSLPRKNLGLQNFIELFDLNNKFYFPLDSKTYNTLEEIIIGPDKLGKCLQINFSDSNPYNRVISISDLEKMPK